MLVCTGVLPLRLVDSVVETVIISMSLLLVSMHPYVQTTKKHSYSGTSLYTDRGGSGPINNNGLIISANDRLLFDCVSNSSQSGVGTITPPDGVDLSVLIIHPFNRPGVIRFRTRELPLQHSDQGIYTCTIPDSNGRNISLNVGLYPPGFNGELTSPVIVGNHSLSTHTEGPSISYLTYDEESRALTCISTGSPPTRVVWMKDGSYLTTDGSSLHYSLSQTITNRSSSTYFNVLRVRQSAPGVAGTYTCKVSNDLGSASMTVVAVGECRKAYTLSDYHHMSSFRCHYFWFEWSFYCWSIS